MPREAMCNICASDQYKILYRPKHLSEDKERYLITEAFPKLPQQIVKCARCGLVYVNTAKDLDEIASSYINMSDEEYRNEERGRRISARRVLGRLKGLRKAGRLLDIGCATGFLVDEARKDGWEAYGVELSKWCVEYANNKLALGVFRGSLKDAKFEDIFFDAVILKDTIEHLPDPKDTLLEISRIIKPDGIVCISTPDIDSLISKILKARWWGINHAHLFYFTKDTIVRLLNSAGFEPLKCAWHPRTFSFNYWVFRFRNYNKIIHRILKFFADNTPLKDALITINTADQIEIYAKKPAAHY